MNLTKYVKTDAAADADPRTTPPAAERKFLLQHHRVADIEIGAVALRFRVLDAADALVAAGTVDVQIYIWDSEGSLWLLHDDLVGAVARDRTLMIGLPPTMQTATIFVQITNVTGTGAAKVEIGYAPMRVSTWARLRTGVTGVITSLAGILNVLLVGKFNATKPSLLDGQATEVQFTSRGAVLVANDEPPQGQDDTNRIFAVKERPFVDSTYGWLLYRSTALEASAVVKNAAGMLKGFDVRVDSTLASGTYYVQILNHASLPADGAVTHLIAPVKVIHTVGFDDFIEDRFPDVSAGTGVVVCLSTTEFTKTIGGAYLSSNFWGA